MGRQSKGARAQSAIDEELSDYFLRGDSVFGMSSSFAPLVGIALGGFGGSPDPERSLVRRHQLGPATETAVTRFRVTRASLMRLSKLHHDALTLYYGPIDWLGVYRSQFGHGKGGKGKGDEVHRKVFKKLGPLLGVALLTDKVQKGFAAEQRKAAERREKTEAKSGPGTVERHGERLMAIRSAPLPEADRWSNPLGWTAAACMSERSGDKAADDIREQARALHVAAVFAYTDTVRIVAAEREAGKPWDRWEQGAA